MGIVSADFRPSTIAQIPDSSSSFAADKYAHGTSAGGRIRCSEDAANLAESRCRTGGAELDQCEMGDAMQWGANL